MCVRHKLTWIHFVEWAAGWRRAGRRISVRDPPSTAPDRQIDRHLTPFSLNFPFQLNFQLFHWILTFRDEMWLFEVRKCFVNFCCFPNFKFWCRNYCLESGNSHGHIDDALLCFLLLLLLLHDGTFFLSLVFLKPLSRLFNSKNLLLVIYFVRNVLFLKFWWKTFSGLLAVNWILGLVDGLTGKT